MRRKSPALFISLKHLLDRLISSGDFRSKYNDDDRRQSRSRYNNNHFSYNNNGKLILKEGYEVSQHRKHMQKIHQNQQEYRFRKYLLQQINNMQNCEVLTHQ
ncbi:hypothetical protein TNCV_4444861 [Trichonephila clavipes]|nr:hypothetical protein TNCV_4444861 [Trichonephila clavipes]